MNGWRLFSPERRPRAEASSEKSGRERLRLYAGKRVWVVHANARRAFVGAGNGVNVVELPSGRVLERRRSVAYPLVPPGPASENS